MIIFLIAFSLIFSYQHYFTLLCVLLIVGVSENWIQLEKVLILRLKRNSPYTLKEVQTVVISMLPNEHVPEVWF